MAAVSRLTVRVDRVRLTGSLLSALPRPASSGDGDEEEDTSTTDWKIYATCGTSNTAGASGNTKKGKVRSVLGNAPTAVLGDLFQFEFDTEELTHRYVTISIWCASFDDGLGDDPVFEVLRTCTVALWNEQHVLLWRGEHAAVIEVESAYGTYSGEFPLQPTEGVIELTCCFAPVETEDTSVPLDESEALTTKQLRTRRQPARCLSHQIHMPGRPCPDCARPTVLALVRLKSSRWPRRTCARRFCSQDGTRAGYKYKYSRWTASCPTWKSRTSSSQRSYRPPSAAHSQRLALMAGCALPPRPLRPRRASAIRTHRTGSCGRAE